MPVLSNPKHERFAQELAKGKSATEAYVSAGYSANEGNAGRLNRNERVQARVAELLDRAAVRVELDRARVTESLIRIAEKAEGLGESPGLAVARAAWMDAAKLNGLVVDLKEVGKPGDFTRLTDDELDDRIQAAARAFGRPVAREASAQAALPAGAGRRPH